jgi:UPF0755 protein
MRKGSKNVVDEDTAVLPSRDEITRAEKQSTDGKTSSRRSAARRESQSADVETIADDEQDDADARAAGVKTAGDADTDDSELPKGDAHIEDGEPAEDGETPDGDTPVSTVPPSLAGEIIGKIGAVFAPIRVKLRNLIRGPDDSGDETADEGGDATDEDTRKKGLAPLTSDATRPFRREESATRAHSDGGDADLDIGPEKFKMKFDFETAYRDVPDNRPLRPRRETRTGLIGGLLYAAFMLSISVVLASLMWMATADVLGFNAVNEQVNVVIPNDFAMEDVTELLYEAGVIRYKFLFNIYADYSSAEEKISAGAYVLNKNFDYRAIVDGMTKRRGARVETTVTIPEGYYLADIFKRLDDYGVCSSEALWEAAENYDFDYWFLEDIPLGDKYRLEGYLFPDTYNFYIDATPVQAISTMLREFNNKFTEEYIERAATMERSVHEIITVASMIEREAGDDEERPRIAAVIYNRLTSRDFSPRYLQIDATILYVMSRTGQAFSTSIDSPYNTYLHEGLPPAPISSPGLESIRAALYPQRTNEFYYALNKKGTHNFFRTAAQHQTFVNGPDYGG